MESARITNGVGEECILVGMSEGKRPLGKQNVGGWVILKWTLER
jgi:hypothetical protein